MKTRLQHTPPSSMRRIRLFPALILLAILWLLGNLAYTLLVEDREIQAVNAERAKVFEPVRQALLAYHKERQRFPESLDELVPRYLTAIPPVLAIRDHADPVMNISYQRDGDGAHFVYRTTHGPDSRAVFDVPSGHIELDP